MSSYAVIDAICDAINPLLFLVIVAAELRQLAKKRYQASMALLGALIYGLTVIYGLYYFDLALGLWPYFGLDYSSHSAFALVMCAIIALFIGARLVVAGVLVAYLLAMVYQQYHSVADVLTTVVAVTALVAPVLTLVYRNLRAEPDVTR